MTEPVTTAPTTSTMMKWMNNVCEAYLDGDEFYRPDADQLSYYRSGDDLNRQYATRIRRNPDDDRT